MRASLRSPNCKTCYETSVDKAVTRESDKLTDGGKQSTHFKHKPTQLVFIGFFHKKSQGKVVKIQSFQHMKQ